MNTIKVIAREILIVLIMFLASFAFIWNMFDMVTRGEQFIMSMLMTCVLYCVYLCFKDM